MIRCAGILIRADDGTVLVLQRAPAEGDCVGLWDFPGGHVDDGETVADAAIREAREEIGVDFDTAGEVLMRSTAFGADYTTFLKRVPEPFAPKLNAEHCAFAWVRPDAVSPMAEMPMAPTNALVAATPDAGRSDADFKETDHPRGEGGKFGSGSKVHIVTTHDKDTGDTTFEHVGADKKAAHAVYDKVEDGDDDTDGDDSAEYHTEHLDHDGDGVPDAIHIVHAPDGSGGVDIHSAHSDPDVARGHAITKSQQAWDDDGPDRSEVDADPMELVSAAEAWNDDHAGDHDDVKVVIDPDTGEVSTDENGDPEFEQDGVPVNPGDDRLAAFRDLMEEMHPQDGRAAYPGIDAANEHFTAEGRHESVFKVHRHEVK